MTNIKEPLKDSVEMRKFCPSIFPCAMEGFMMKKTSCSSKIEITILDGYTFFEDWGYIFLSLKNTYLFSKKCTLVMFVSFVPEV